MRLTALHQCAVQLLADAAVLAVYEAVCNSVERDDSENVGLTMKPSIQPTQLRGY
jgi:hypothetical protein